jgi:hypothetical protein
MEGIEGVKPVEKEILFSKARKAGVFPMEDAALPDNLHGSYALHSLFHGHSPPSPLLGAGTFPWESS